MKKLVIILVTLSVCLASGNIQKQMDDLMRSLQYKYQIYGPADLHKLKTQQPTQDGRAASRDMGDLVGDWIVEEESNELFITVGADQSIANPFSMMALMEAEGSITATAADYQTELTYLLDGEMMEDGDDSGDDCDMNCYGEYDEYMNDGSDVSDAFEYSVDCSGEQYSGEGAAGLGQGSDGWDYTDQCGECDDNALTDCYDLSIDLNPGANLISFPALPVDVSVENIFAGTEGVIGEGIGAINIDGNWNIYRAFEYFSFNY